MVLPTPGNANSFSQDQPLTFCLQSQFSNRPALSEPCLGRCALSKYSYSSSCNWCSEFYNQTGSRPSASGATRRWPPVSFNPDILIQSFPVIIALETSPGTAIGNRASVLHAILQGKHASLLNTRYSVSARASFDYQKKVSVDSVRGIKNFLPHVRILRCSRFPLATYTHRSSATMVFARSRKATNPTRLFEIASQGVPRKLFIWIDAGVVSL